MFGWISFTTDYGRSDGFVGICHGVIATIAPQVRVLDVTHDVPAGGIRHAAVVLADVVGYLPPAVHLAVVDPGVGTGRRGLAIATPRGALVGPDNGLLLDAAAALGGITAAVELTAPEFRLPTVSATFHGRDVFAPAAAHLALGVELAALGPAVPEADLVRLPAPVCRAEPARLTVEVLAVDHFGNVALAASAEHLATVGLAIGDPVSLRWGGNRARAVVGTTFADVPVGELVLQVDSAGRLAVACHQGSAADRWKLRPGTVVEVSTS